MRHTHFALVTFVAVASPTNAQTRLCFTIAPTFNGSEWMMHAELINPTGNIRATIADLGFTMSGVNFSNFTYNPAFDSDFFGDANVSVTSSQIDFLGGNTIPPLNNAGGPDSSNPLHIATFQADSVDSFMLVGQVTGAYVGSPFDTILTYQNADGTPGDTPWGDDLGCLPSPGSAAAVILGGAVSLRRRR
ncbi:MAG: hypothetical protein Phyf2KO_12760 [Phycisphaerales bacterium]